MRGMTTLRNLSLGVATASFMLAAAAFAQTDLAGGTARLDHTIDTQSAQQGQAVEAKLDGTVKQAGIDLPRGTELIGQLSDVHASQNGGPSSVSLTFTQARLKGGKEIPIRVTVVGAYPSSAGDDASSGQDIVAPTAQHINPQEKVDQEAGLLGHVSMTASADGNRSATFHDQGGNVRLQQGTCLQVGIAPASASGVTSGAE